MISERFFRRTECRVPTALGWAVIGVCLSAAMVAFVFGVHPFLAVTHPVRGDFLVVEGWLSKYALKEAVETFRAGGYRQIVTTGGPIPEGSYLAELLPEFGTFAEVSAAALERMGVPADRISAVPVPPALRNRTYASFVALREWMSTAAPSAESVDIFTLGPHARRSRLLLERVLGGRIRVGVIACENRSYDPRRWWTSSTGIRKVFGETLGYVYARVFLFFQD